MGIIINCDHAFFAVDPQDYDNLVAANTNEFLNAPYASPREFREENHSLYVVIFELRALEKDLVKDGNTY